MKNFGVFLRLGALVAIVAILVFSLSDSGETFHGYLDIKAALLVFLTPICVSILFLRERVNWRYATSRIVEVRRREFSDLAEELQAATTGNTGHLSVSQIATLSEAHSDSFVRYATGLFVSRFSADEIGELLAQRIEAEDAHWRSVSNFIGFLAKMAPYFGMLATVVGMVKLLQNMNDYSKISSGMALAMQGTLYGLISFTMVYSPLQRFFGGYRDLFNKRNELVTRWIVSLSQRADPHFIKEALKITELSLESPLKKLGPDGVTPTQSKIGGANGEGRQATPEMSSAT